MYDPNSSTACLSKDNSRPVRRKCGECTLDTPLAAGNAFSQRVQFLRRCISITCGKFLNGRMLYALWVRSFRVWMYLSISGTCSPATQQIDMGKDGCSASNSGSQVMEVMWNPQWWYSQITFFRQVATVPTWQLGRDSTMLKQMLHDDVTRNGILFTNMMSTERTTS